MYTSSPRTTLGVVATAIAMVVMLLIPFNTVDAFMMRRACNPVAGKKQALKFIQSSEYLSQLAGLEFVPAEIDEHTLNADGEILSDIDESSLDSDGLALLEEEEAALAGNAELNLEIFQEEWLEFMDQVDAEAGFTVGGVEKKVIMDNIMHWVGTRYKYGGMSKRGIDCSAFTQSVYKLSANVLLPRTARVQYTVGQPIEDVRELQFGDLIYFNTRRRPYVSHCAVYLGENLFAHASSRYGVTVSSLESKYYAKRFIAGRRLMPEDLLDMTIGMDDE